MKVSFKKLIILIFLFVMFGSFSYATTYVYTTGTNLRIRKSPNSTSSSNIITTIPKINTKLELIKKDTSWSKVKYNNIEGYVSTRYIVEENSDESGENIEKVTTYVNAYNVNVRKGAGTNYASLGKVNRGEKLIAIGNISSVGKTTCVKSKATDWVKVEFGDNTGYILGNYLSKTFIMPEFSTKSKSIVQIAKDLKEYYADNNFVYGTNCVSVIPTKSPIDINKRSTTDCSTYVSAVLYYYAVNNNKSTMKDTFSNRKKAYMFAQNNYNGLKDVTTEVKKDINNAKEGDILVYSGHTEIYAGSTSDIEGKTYARVYNCGSTEFISIKDSTDATRPIEKIVRVLRIK